MELAALLSEPEWRTRERRHKTRVRPWVQPLRERRVTGTSHPVDDFLFTYYSFRPSWLARWHPGLGVTCAVQGDLDPGGSLTGRGYERTPSGVRLNASAFAERARTARWVYQLLDRSSRRAAAFGCFGLHEWAMVYRLDPDQVRHSSWPLRLTPDEIADVVEGIGPRCTHFDAFRFFTEPARTLNVSVLTRDDQLSSEQPGCLHATMDLYKWAYKLSPMTPSELVADCFELARDVRFVDMQASPYDLTDLGVPPIAVETADGRSEYVARQRAFVDRAAPLRTRLLEHAEKILRALSDVSDEPAS